MITVKGSRLHYAQCHYSLMRQAMAFLRNLNSLESDSRGRLISISLSLELASNFLFPLLLLFASDFAQDLQSSWDSLVERDRKSPDLSGAIADADGEKRKSRVEGERRCRERSQVGVETELGVRQRGAEKGNKS